MLSLNAETLIQQTFPENSDITVISAKSPAEEVRDLIGQGESVSLEFKSTARWDIKQSQLGKHLEQVIVKTVAAFLNFEGGQLLIGVDDEGQVLGLENDYKTLGKKANRDGYENWLTTLLLDAYGKDAASFIRISFVEVDRLDVCRVMVRPSSQPIYVTEGNDERLYIRAGNSSRALSTREAVDYTRQHWK